MLIALVVVACGAALAIGALERTRERSRDMAARAAAAARMSAVLAEALDNEEHVAPALRVLVPQFADWCVLHVLEGEMVRRAAIVHVDPDLEREFRAAVERVPFDTGAPIGPARVMREGRPELMQRMTPELLASQPEPFRQLVPRVGYHSAIVVPLRSRRQTIGSLTLARGRTRRSYSADLVEWADDLGRRIGLAIENARLYREARELFEQTVSANFVSTPDGRLLACNQTFAELAGYRSPDEVLELRADSLYPEAGARQRFLGELQAHGRLTGYENRLRRRDGALVEVLENAVGAFDERGTLVKITGFLVDRTAQLDLERQLRQAQRLEAVGQLAGGIAHDFNNLLTVIIGCADLLRAEGAPPPPGTHDPLDELIKAADRAAALTHQLLAFSRRQVLQPRVVDLNDAIRHIYTMLRRLLRENVTCVLDLDPAVHRVRVDPGQLDQVVINLVVNAGDAMPDGGTLTLRTANLTETAQQERYVCLEVRDTGIGMDEATRARVFEPFFTTKPIGKGTGLGLSTVYGIVRQSGGTVRIDSAPGAGASVTVWLPAAADAAAG